MKTYCPKCNEKYDEPQPDDYICGYCAYGLALEKIVQIKKPIIVIDKSSVNIIDRQYAKAIKKN